MTSEWIFFVSVFIGLVSFTITLFLKDMDGPMNVISWLRSHLCIYTNVVVPGTDMAFEEPANLFARLFDCFWCLTTWVTTIVAVAYFLLIGFPLLWIVFVIPASIAISGGMYSIIS